MTSIIALAESLTLYCNIEKASARIAARLLSKLFAILPKDTSTTPSFADCMNVSIFVGNFLEGFIVVGPIIFASDGNNKIT